MSKIKNEKTTVYATGWKGFYPGLICVANGNSRQYNVGEVAEEKGGNICSKGMLHFCHKHPLDVFEFYPPVTNKGISEYAIVEAHAPIQESNEKAATTKLKVVAKLDLAGICQLAVDFVFSKTKNKRKQLATGYKGAASATGYSGAASATGYYGAASATGYKGAASATGYSGAASATGYYGAASATGYKGAASATGYYGAASATGYYGAASATGYSGAASATGKESFAFATGFQGKAKGSIGSWIGCAEYALNEDGLYHPVDFKVVRVDGKTIKEDVFYRLQNGKFVEVEE